MENAKYQQEQINQTGFDMLTMCIRQFDKATEAFLNHDSDLAEEVIYKESRINALDIKIEKDCERFIALFNPVAVDLRFIMAILKINGELERIADHAYAMSKYVVDSDEGIPEHLFEAVNYQIMIDTISVMFDHIIDAYENDNVKAARKVFKLDKILDKVNDNSFKIIEQEIKKDINVTAKALKLMSVIKKTERVGDLIKNIAEEIIFYLEVEILKHRKKKK